MLEAKTIEFNEKNFDSEVLKSKIPVLVDFWAAWCAPCRMIAPIVEEIAKEFEGKIKVGKVNVDENSSLAQRFYITGIPTLILFKEGKVKESLTGVRPKAEILKYLNKYL